MIFSVAELVVYLSRFCTLLPGDLIFTGTPGSTRPMRPGDVVEVTLQGVGTVRNRIGAR
ncbi:MAG: fumarylacetoacetate hydrolase family protein [Myxococcota bacterium]